LLLNMVRMGVYDPRLRIREVLLIHIRGLDRWYR
jgi:hypothetical protein